MSLSITHRLDTLPARSALPFRQLLTTGNISEDALACILDAGEISGETSKLVGFAVAFYHLRSQGVAVHDVIRMAKHQKRRINLAWSASRWKEEHDRLSRVEALHAMSRDNVQYDLRQYEARLPAHFAGYLIRSRRRLGMEGFRQRHCVASYHEQIQTGAVAIATVFVDKQRWTVELKKTDEHERPLRIGQVRTRFNAVPSVHIRRQIHQMLGIEQPAESGASGTLDESPPLYMENLRRLIPVLQELSVRGVTVSFDGRGDSGCIDDIAYDPPIDSLADDRTVEYMTTERTFDDGAWRSVVVPHRASISEVINTITYDYLEEADVDWYNGDGGYGDLEIDVERQTVSVNVSVRFTHSELEYSAEIDIQSGREL